MIDGMAHGRGIAYDREGIPIYEGNFKNDELDINGYGKEFWDNGNVMFEGYFENGERLEGNVFEKNGIFSKYLAYPPISIIGSWVAQDVLNNSSEVYGLTFKEDGSFQATDDKKFKGDYEFEDYNKETSEATLTLSVKGQSALTGGNISFNNKNQFLLSTEQGEMLLFIREGTGGEKDY
ncbi:hypothetical protein BGM26_07135 [Bacillus sp. FJAT-29790]|uniref:hypothetical protein n=1 Tax=Bacillus sp. FJAT-29790 TaxID=1895002 RepID=UPI001C238A3F|nr:hypothetical protein [Bacillus sp. FJAT-29790]MBU8878764.1 hypothetical protein [Bacillus sp. FJAT-29790]